MTATDFMVKVIISWDENPKLVGHPYWFPKGLDI